jgi:hypothetical protein
MLAVCQLKVFSTKIFQTTGRLEKVFFKQKNIKTAVKFPKRAVLF